MILNGENWLRAKCLLGLWVQKFPKKPAFRDPGEDIEKLIWIKTPQCASCLQGTRLPLRDRRVDGESESEDERLRFRECRFRPVALNTFEWNYWNLLNLFKCWSRHRQKLHSWFTNNDSEIFMTKLETDQSSSPPSTKMTRFYIPINHHISLQHIEIFFERKIKANRGIRCHVVVLMLCEGQLQESSFGMTRATQPHLSEIAKMVIYLERNFAPPRRGK